MNTLILCSQIAISLAVLNVWLLRAPKSTAWRGGNARTLREEFQVYGLPRWALVAVGFSKITLAALLLVGVWVPFVAKPAALFLSVFMIGAIVMHLKVGDAIVKSLPAASILALSLLIGLS
ncbi:MAG: DoxX family protein [Bryobacteraceae bacterium]